MQCRILRDEFNYLLIKFSLSFPDCQCILLKDVGVPSFAIQGKEAVLTCDYDLENQDLYAVKWYKNGLEFYRYLSDLLLYEGQSPVAIRRQSYFRFNDCFRFVPGSYPDTMTVYARPGVDVDKKRSDERQVTLTHLKMASTGRYRCEVSMEAPSFATVSNYGDMVVVGKWHHEEEEEEEIGLSQQRWQST